MYVCPGDQEASTETQAVNNRSMNWAAASVVFDISWRRLAYHYTHIQSNQLGIGAFARRVARHNHTLQHKEHFPAISRILWISTCVNLSPPPSLLTHLVRVHQKK